jgi:DNA-binding IclR family transcriptional regulator
MASSIAEHFQICQTASAMLNPHSDRKSSPASGDARPVRARGTQPTVGRERSLDRQPPSPKRAIQSAEIGGRLLLTLAEAQAALPLKELAARSGLSASRAHPYLVSLRNLGLVTQDAAQGHYALGPAALRIGLSALGQLDPLREAESAAAELAGSTGHAVALAVWGSFGPTVVRLLEAHRALHVTLRVGHVMSLGETATGRTFAALLPTQRLEEALAAGPQVHAGLASAKARRALNEEALAEWRAHGLLRAQGRPIPGVNAFSAPVFGHRGELLLAMTVLDHQSRLPSSHRGPSAQALKATAARVSGRLGYTQPAG